MMRIEHTEEVSFHSIPFQIFKKECRNFCIVISLVLQDVFFTSVKCGDIITEFDNKSVFHIGGVHRFCLAFVEEILTLHVPLLLCLIICLLYTSPSPRDGL